MAAIAFLVCAVSLICGAWCFKANQRYRGAVNSSLRNELDIPESRFWYDSDYLNKFIALAGTRSTPFGKTALQLYVAPCLLWLDVGFAVGCAAFAALFWVGFLLLFPDNQTLFRIFMFFIWMAVAFNVVCFWGPKLELSVSKTMKRWARAFSAARAAAPSSSLSRP